MAKRQSVFWICIVLGIVMLIGSGLLYTKLKANKKASFTKVTYPEYINLNGGYALSVPKDYVVEEYALSGVALIYKPPLLAKTAENVINYGAISAESINNSAYNPKSFIKYVNDTFLPKLKDNLKTSDVSVKFDKINNQDVAYITVEKGAKPFRFIKGGQHPVVLVSKFDSDEFKSIQGTLTDVEKSDVKEQIESFKLSMKSALELVKNQDAKKLYENASTDLRSKTTEEELSNALKAGEEYLKGTITVTGVSYTQDEFAARVKYVKLGGNDEQAGFGSISFKKGDNNTWKLNSLTVPRSS
jgi:hypothetical protein